MTGPSVQQRPGYAPWSWPHLADKGSIQLACHSYYLACQVHVKEEVLRQLLSGAQLVHSDQILDSWQWGQSSGSHSNSFDQVFSLKLLLTGKVSFPMTVPLVQLCGQMKLASSTEKLHKEIKQLKLRNIQIALEFIFSR